MSILTRIVMGLALIAPAFAQNFRLAVITKQQPGPNCEVPLPETSFPIDTPNLYVWFLINDVPAGTVYRVQWVKPDGWVHSTADFAPSSGGSFCFHTGWQPAASDLSSAIGDWFAIILLLRDGQKTVTTVPFRMTASSSAQRPPAILEGGIAEPWTYQRGLSPGGWATLYGSNLAGTQESWRPIPGEALPTSLGGVTVRVDGQRVPIAFVSPGILNFLAPASLTEGSARVEVERNGILSAPFTSITRRINPAIYSLPDTSRKPVAYSVTAARAGTAELVGNPALDARVTRGAFPSEAIDLYVTGLGRTTGGFPVDRMFTGAFPVAEPIQVDLDGTLVQPDFAGLISPGLYQVRFSVPPDARPGDRPIRIRSGDVSSAGEVFLRIQDPNPPPIIESVTLSPDTITAGGTTDGVVTLSAPAPAGGAEIMLSTATSAPTPFGIAAGRRTVGFRWTPAPAPAPRTETVYARWNGSEKSARLSILASPQSNAISDYEMQIDGSAMLEGRQVQMRVTINVPYPIPFGIVDSSLSISSGVILYAYYSGPAVTGNSVTFSSVNGMGAYSNLSTNVFAERITSGRLTMTVNSASPGSPVTGTIQFQTLSRNIMTNFSGSVTSSTKIK